MNIDFTEVDDLGNNNGNYFDVNNYQNNNNNYWETSKIEPPKKKKFSYDDILNSLNLVVNKNGVLQYMTVNQNDTQEYPQQQQQYPQQQQQYNQQQYPQQQYPQQQIKGKPLEPQVKNSFIFNKYFKDYKDPNIEYNEPKKPQTIEEYNQMILDERIRRIKERQRISQIKSTKMLFENNNNIQASKNNLRMMKFN